MTIYQIIQPVVSCSFKHLFKLQAQGLENIPDGGAIIASNHITLLDPPAIGAALHRPIHFMAKQELFLNPAFAWIITKLNAFPVQRGTPDRNAIRRALKLLTQQQLLGIFPEGTRSKTGALGDAEPGVALIAAKLGMPIVPTAIINNPQTIFGRWQRPRLTITFGSAIYPEPKKTDRETLNQLSQTMMNAIADLLSSHK